MRVGIQLSSLAPFLSTDVNLERVLYRLSETGFRRAQLQWIHPDIPAENIAEALVRNRIESLGTQERYDACVRRLNAFIRINRACGSNDVCFSGIPARFLTDEDISAYVDKMKAHMLALADEGMRASYHPVAFDFRPLRGSSAAEIVLNELPDLMVVPDTNQLIRAGLDAAEWLRAHAGRASMVHFKDMETTWEGAALTPVGQGCTPFPEIISACRDAGVETVLIEQETWKGDPYECMAASLEYVNGLLSDTPE